MTTDQVPTSLSPTHTPTSDSTATATAPKVKLKYRLAKSKSDLELIRVYRRECGWGEKKIVDNWGNPDRPLCVFSVVKEGKGKDEEEEEEEDVGMGGWVLEMKGEEWAASRATRTVQISSLFIREKYRKGGIGSSAVDLLEKAAVELYDARTITLDTTAYECTSWIEVTEDGKQITRFKEDWQREGRSVQWYRSRGYTQYRPNEPRFPHPLPDDPDRLLIAMFLKKDVA